MEIFWRTIAYYNSCYLAVTDSYHSDWYCIDRIAYRPTTSVGENGDEVLYDRLVYVDFSGLLLYLL